MTLLALTDIEPGLVAWMDTATLLRDARTRTSYTGKPFRTGPFFVRWRGAERDVLADTHAPYQQARLAVSHIPGVADRRAARMARPIRVLQ